MKNVNRILFAAAIATAFNLAGIANAQVGPNDRDGIAASPKVRQMLNERAASARPGAVVHQHETSTVASAGQPAARSVEIAASPKVQQALNERRTTAGASGNQVASVGYQATGADGISAAPKLRQQLNERHATFTVAPVK
jgi:hypothetical protein